MSSNFDALQLGSGLRTTVSIAKARGGAQFVCDIKCETDWNDLAHEAHKVAAWLSSRSLDFAVVCSESRRSWVRFRIHAVPEMLILQLLERWGGIPAHQSARDRILASDIRQFEGQLLAAERQLANLSRQIGSWAARFEDSFSYSPQARAEGRL